MWKEISNLENSNKSLVNNIIRPPFHDERESEENVNLMDYWRIILRQRWTIISVLVVFTVIVTIGTFKMKPVYQATTTLRISREAPKVLSFEDVVKTSGLNYSGDDFYRTQYEIIKSRTLADKVIKRLNLDQHPEFAPTDEDSPIDGIKTALVMWLSNAVGSEKTLTGGIWDKDFEKSALIDAFLRRIEIQPIRNSELVKVNANTYYPDLSALITNTLAEEYIQQNLQNKTVTTIDASGQLSEQLVELKGRLEESEMALYRYCEGNDIVALDEKQSILQENLKRISTLLTEAEAKHIDVETMCAVLKNADVESIPAVIKSTLIDDLEIEYVKANAEYLFELGRLKPDHPGALRIKTQMETIKQMMDARVQRFKDGMELEYKQALAKEEELRGKLEDLKKEVLVIAKKTIPYKSLEREVKANTELYNGLLQRMKEAGVSSGIKTTNVQVVDGAEIPKVPYKPKKKLNILLAMLVGLTFGTGLAFFLDYLDNTVKGPDDVENRIKLPLLGFVPTIEDLKNSEGENGTDDTFRKDLIAHYELRSSASEAYRTIRTGVLFSSPDRKVHSILVTSAYPTEGKTVTAVNLATVLAQGNDSVLLIDADLRRPRIHKTFKIDNSKGLTNLLIGEASMDEVIQESPVENLYVLPSGPIPPNPSELLGSKSMDELIEKLKGKYARIVIDSSPMVAVTDARIIATKVDGCICVIRAAKSDIRGTKRAKEQLEDIGGRFIGAILNNVSMDRRSSYGYYYYRYGYYHHYYGEDEKKDT